jgi:hypothetical protein
VKPALSSLVMIPLGRPDLGLDLYMLREAPSATPTTNIIVRPGDDEAE